MSWGQCAGMVTPSNPIDIQHYRQDIKVKANNDSSNTRFLVSYDPQRGIVVVKGQEGDGSNLILTTEELPCLKHKNKNRFNSAAVGINSTALNCFCSS